jgi:hypothetical protein
MSFLSAGAATATGAAAVDARGRIEVEFLADGRCSVSATGETFHSRLSYTPHAVAAISERRCAIPPVPDGTPVDLTVSLPRGASRPTGGEIPRLAWAQLDDRWVGTASLTMAPPIVRIPTTGGHTGLRESALATVGVCAALALLWAGLLWWRDRAR